MPLDAPRYLTAQGWGGNGQPLRPNSNGIRKPIIIAQKNSLGGVGNDRDSAFAFWDHVYAASAKTIQIKLHTDSDDTEEESVHASPSIVSPSPPWSGISRTSTGLISNRQPHVGTSASAFPWPDAMPPAEGSRPAKLSLGALAKREAARQRLYMRFYRGPLIGMGDSLASTSAPVALETPTPLATSPTPSLDTIVGPSSNGSATSDPSVDPSTIAADELALKAEHKAAKAARRTEREARRQRKQRRREEKAAKKEHGIPKPSTSLSSETTITPPASAQLSSSSSQTPELPVISDPPSSRRSKKRKLADTEEFEIKQVVTTKGKIIDALSRKKRKKQKQLDPDQVPMLPPVASTSAALDASAVTETRAIPSRAILKIRRTSKDRKDKVRNSRGRDSGLEEDRPPKKKRVTFCETVQQRVVARWLDQI